MINKKVLTELGVSDEKTQEELLQCYYYDLEEAKLEMRDMLECKNDLLLVHCKSCHNFQTIEFDFNLDVKDEASLEALKDIYIKLYNVVKECAPDDSKTVKNEDLITDSQKALMKKLNMKYTDSMSMEEARIKIKNHLQK